MKTQQKASLKYVWISLIVPPILLGMLIFTYVILSGAATEGKDMNALVRSALPYILAVNHTLVFLMLLYFLRQSGKRLSDIGWNAPNAGYVISQIALGLLVGLALYLWKEFAVDSVRAVMAGQTPTFHSLFNFGLDNSDIPMLFAATTLIFVEESIYRGFAIPPLRERYGLAGALVVSSFFFGLLHWGNGLFAIGATSVYGLFFALIFLWRRNLIAVTVGHALYNFFVIVT